MPILFLSPYKNTVAAVDVVGDTYFNNVSMLMHLNGTNGATAGASFIDVVTSRTFTNRGTAQISTAQSKFGGSSLLLNTSSSLSTPSTPNMVFGTDDFTVEAWVYPVGNTLYGGSIVSKYQNQGNTTINGWSLAINGTAAPSFGLNFTLRDASSAIITATYTPYLTLNTWHHVAATRIGTNLYVWLNGSLVASGTSSTVISDTYTGNIVIGNFGNGNLGVQTNVNGYIDDIRVTKGVARYTGAFTPPTAAFPDSTGVDANYANVTFLANMDSITAGNTFTEAKGKTVTSVGVASQSAVAKFIQAAQFNGTSSYLTVPGDAAFNFGTGDFTIEGWFYNTSFANTGSPASNQAIMETRNQSNTQEANRYVLAVLSNGAVQWTNATNDALTVSTVLMSLNTWNHVAVTRSGTTLRVFVNGQLGATSTDSQSYSVGTTVAFGALRQATGSGWVRGFFTGYMDDIRITKGVARYTAAFTPPIAQSPTQ